MNKAIVASILAASCMAFVGCEVGYDDGDPGHAEALGSFLPRSQQSAGCYRSSVALEGICSSRDTDERYRLTLIGGLKGTFAIDSSESIFGSASGEYKVRGNQIVLADDEVVCSAGLGRIAVGDETGAKYLNCVLDDSSHIAFFDNCNQIQFTLADEVDDYEGC